jgi:hypothetical protein
VDDAAVFPPGNRPLADAVRAYDDRRGEWYAGLVRSFVVADVALPEALAQDAGAAPSPLSVVIGGGAGSVAGVCAYATRNQTALAGLEIALRDLDDLAGNARRVVAAVDAARGSGDLADEVPVFVEMPQDAPTAGWLAAADEVAAAELPLKFRTGGVEAHLFPDADRVATWIDAALDRELPFKCTAGLHRAIRHTGADGFEHHGFLNVLLATRRAFDGASTDDVVATLETRDADALVDQAMAEDLAGARRWFTSYGSCSVEEPLADLLDLGLLEGPA